MNREIDGESPCTKFLNVTEFAQAINRGRSAPAPMRLAAQQIERARLNVLRGVVPTGPLLRCRRRDGAYHFAMRHRECADRQCFSLATLLARMLISDGSTDLEDCVERSTGRRPYPALIARQ